MNDRTNVYIPPEHRGGYKKPKPITKMEASMNEKYTFATLASLSEFLTEHVKDKGAILPERSSHIRLELKEEKLTDGSTVTNCTIYA